MPAKLACNERPKKYFLTFDVAGHLLPFQAPVNSSLVAIKVHEEGDDEDIYWYTSQEIADHIKDQCNMEGGRYTLMVTCVLDEVENARLMYQSLSVSSDDDTTSSS